jgi:hypothetical protein
MSRLTTPLLVATLVACGSATEPTEGDLCMVQSLPFSSGADAPTVTDIGLELQPTEGVVVVATVSDAQGGENLRDVIQSVGVFPDSRCEGTPFVVQDDFVDVGVEETFGTAVSIAAHPDVYAAIDASVRWPVEVDFVDLDGNRTKGRLSARLIR